MISKPWNIINAQVYVLLSYMAFEYVVIWFLTIIYNDISRLIDNNLTIIRLPMVFLYKAHIDFGDEWYWTSILFRIYIKFIWLSTAEYCLQFFRLLIEIHFYFIINNLFK